MNNENNIAPINEELNIVKYDIEVIQKRICIIRGKQVILDNDIAYLYDVETKRVNEAVKRNIKRFPEEFCFQLTEEEYNSLRSQFATLKNYGRGQHRKYLPYAFTEQGVAMLSAVLHSEKAIRTSINIMNAFVEMRRFIANNQLMFEKISNIELKQLEYQKATDENFEIIFKYIENHKEENQKIFFEGQIYDAYSLIIDIIKKANSKITIIDNYRVSNIKNIENK